MAKTTRLKAKAEAVPQSREEADRLLGQIGALQREIGRIDADKDDAVAAANQIAADRKQPIEATIKAKFSALTVWANAHRSTLLEKDRKSVALSQGTLGWRWGNPTLKVEKDQEDDIIARLETMERDDLLRTTVELDREALLKDPKLVASIAGLSIEQVETFWAKPLDVKAERKIPVETRQGAAVNAADAA